MSEKVLVTGGAGFIGSHIVDGLLERGKDVRVFDCLDPQVHGKAQEIPEYLSKDVEFIRGDILDKEALRKAMNGVSVVYHEAAAVGVGQSMYEIQHYTHVNSTGCAILLDLVANNFRDKIRKMIVASSMSIYGEGKYKAPDGTIVFSKFRVTSDLEKGEWEPKCPKSGEPLTSVPNDEEKPLNPTSIYAITKRDHEEMFISIGAAYHIPAVALRYFNAYGPRQALSNPYTGVAAIFSSRVLNGNAPVVYEDGGQSRDFIHVSDIVQANMLALEKEEANGQVFNVGSGEPQSIRGVGEILINHISPGSDLKPIVENKFREGDIRHCYADITKIKTLLGFEPKVMFEKGVEDLTNWVRQQEAEDRFDDARAELAKRGLA
jgi:dTDP-L-rhamnose 4-epimerase